MLNILTEKMLRLFFFFFLKMMLKSINKEMLSLHFPDSQPISWFDANSQHDLGIHPPLLFYTL